MKLGRLDSAATKPEWAILVLLGVLLLVGAIGEAAHHHDRSDGDPSTCIMCHVVYVVGVAVAIAPR